MMEFIIGGGGTLIVGVDEEQRRVYVGHRYKGIYFDEPAEFVDEVIDLWNRTNQHLIIGRQDLAMLRLKKEDVKVRCTRCNRELHWLGELHRCADGEMYGV